MFYALTLLFYLIWDQGPFKAFLDILGPIFGVKQQATQKGLNRPAKSEVSSMAAQTPFNFGRLRFAQQNQAQAAATWSTNQTSIHVVSTITCV